MVDVDRYNAQDIARRTIRRIAAFEHPPMWPDQDAFNEIVGGKWLSLDRRWNFFHAADYRGFGPADYERADIVHFSGPKPWEQPSHPAIGIYNRALGRMRQKTRQRSPVTGRSDRVFTATAFELLLGRPLESEAIAAERAGLSHEASLACIIGSPEFQAAVLDPLTRGDPLPDDRFGGEPSQAQRYWAIDRLPVLPHTATRLQVARRWRGVLSALAEDRLFMSLAQLQPIVARRRGAAAD
jgi:hypothetical protein